MALFKDGEKVDLKGNSPEAKDFAEKKKWVKDNIGFPVIFKANPSFLAPQVKIDGSGKEKIDPYFAPWYIQNTAEVKTSDGTELWRWCPVVPPKKDGEFVFAHKHKRSEYSKPVFKLDEKDFDRIYFLLFKDEQFKRFYSIDDAKSEANKKVKDKIREAKIQSAFYGENSVFLKNEKRLREVARAWHIPNVEKLSKEQLLIFLETAVREQDQLGLKSIDDFISATESGDIHIETEAILQKAQDLEIIKFDDKLSIWFYLNHDKSYGDKICEVPKNRKEYKYDVLLEYVFVEKEHIARIKSLVNVTDIPDEMKLNFNDLENEDYEKVKAYCNLHGIATTAPGRSKKMVFQDVLEHSKRPR